MRASDKLYCKCVNNCLFQNLRARHSQLVPMSAYMHKNAQPTACAAKVLYCRCLTAFISMHINLCCAVPVLCCAVLCCAVLCCAVCYLCFIVTTTDWCFKIASWLALVAVITQSRFSALCKACQVQCVTLQHTINDITLCTDRQGYSEVLHYAHLEAQMSAKANSSTCIQQATCQPLGGHSVWGAAPPLVETASSPLPIIMLLACVDSTAFFKSATLVSGHYCLLVMPRMLDLSA